MKRFIALLILLIVLVSIVPAQTAPTVEAKHVTYGSLKMPNGKFLLFQTSLDRITISWINLAGSDKVDLFSAKVACPASGLPTGATVLTTLNVPSQSFDFVTGTAGATYCFYLVARDTVSVPGRTSVASATAQATFPVPPLAPPQGVSATSKAAGTP